MAANTGTLAEGTTSPDPPEGTWYHAEQIVDRCWYSKDSFRNVPPASCLQISDVSVLETQ